MKSSLFWQNPHVDLFKQFKILDNKEFSDKKGKDKDIGRKILKIEGNVSNSNYIKFPGREAKQTTLGLIGNFVYLQVIVPIGSQFGFNIVYLVGGKMYKLQFSNLYKQIKKSDNILNIPIAENPNKWSIIGIDSKAYLSNLIDMRNPADYSIKTIELCANMRVKNIFTSNNLYCPHSLPKDLSFILPKNIKFTEKYQFIMLGDKSYQENIEPNDDYKIQEIYETKPQKQVPTKAHLKGMLKNPNQLEDTPDQPRIEPKPFVLQDKQPLMAKSEFQLQPTPIMQLKHVQGFTGGMSNLVMFNKENIIYSTGNLIVMMDLKKRTQKFFFGQYSNITSLCCSTKDNLIVSTDQNQISFWDSNTLERTGFFYTGFSKILSMDICTTGYKQNSAQINVVLSALDNQKRSSIMLLQNSQVLSKQISDFDIQKIKFIDKNDISKGIMTVGKESIRFWKQKTTFDQDNILTGHSVFLGEHARENLFLDFCVYQETSKALVISNLGCIYIVDLNKKEVVGVYQIHEEPCVSISIDTQNNFIVTSDNQGRIKIWQIDFSDVIMEVKLDSQVNNIQILDEKFIICGCLNGTLGILDKEKKVFNYLIRSHNDDVIDMKYHQVALYFLTFNQVSRKIITISSDCSIRIWEILGSEEALFFQEVYEFRCIDEYVTCLQTFNTKHRCICGFETGNIRIFDIFNYQIVCELDFHKTKITDLAINYNDKSGISADQSGKICIFNEELELLKTLECDKTFSECRVGFNYRGDLFYVLQNHYNLKIYSLSSEACKFWIQTQEKIQTICFSTMAEDFFVITEKAKIKKYKINENTRDIKLFREYSALHQGEIFSVTCSKNSKYIFTTGEDNLLKIWDYNLRGGLTPNFQAYNCGERLTWVELSQDDLNLVLSFSKKSRTLFCWKFFANLDKIGEHEQEEEISEIHDSDVLIDEVPEQHIFNNLSKIVEDGNYIEKPVIGEVKGLYPEFDQMNQQNLDQSPQKNPKDQNYQKAESHLSDKKSDKKDIDSVQQESHQENFMQKQYVIGYDSTFTCPQSELIWNLDENYYVMTCNQSLIIQTLQEKREQKIFQEGNDILYPKLSPNGKYFTYCINDQSASIKIIDAKTLKLIKSLVHPSYCENITHCEISPCSNYLITITKICKECLPFLHIFELATSKILACTQLQENIFLDMKWDNVSISTLEFALITKENLYFWRVSHKNTLEYIMVDFDRQQKTQCGDFLCLEYAQCEDRNMLLIGTSQGALLIFDLRTGSLICLCKGILNTPISKMIFSSQKFICLSNNVNVYEWKLIMDDQKQGQIESDSELDQVSQEGEFKIKESFKQGHKLRKIFFQHFIKQIEKKPNIHTLDAIPSKISKNFPTMAYDQVMLITRSGVLWMVDFEEDASLKLTTSHINSKNINSLKYIVQENGNFDNGQLISAGGDQTVKVFDLGFNEQRTEYFTPKKECLCLDVYENLKIIVGGYNDGYIRFFDYVENISLGQVSLETESNQKYSINSLQVIKGTKNMIAGTGCGDVFMIFISKQQCKQKLQVNINPIIESQKIPINIVQASVTEKFDTFLLTQKSGRIQVYSRKNLKRNLNPEEELKNIYELEYYLIDNYKILKNDKLKAEFHENNMADHTCKAVFSNILKDIYYCSHHLINEVQKRNFREHLIIQTIKLQNYPLMMVIPTQIDDVMIVADEKGYVSAYDMVNGILVDTLLVGKNMKINSLELAEQHNQQQRNRQSSVSKASGSMKSLKTLKNLPYLFVGIGNQISVFTLKPPQ